MKHTALALLIALASACTSPSLSPVTASMPAPGMADSEEIYWATRAACLAPAAWAMAWSSPATPYLDVTVPDGHTWYTDNTYAVVVNPDTATGFSQSGTLWERKGGAIRLLDSADVFAAPPGTRFVSSTGQHTSYVWYCDPSLVWDADPRYWSEPGAGRRLFYDRLARLRSMPVVMVGTQATAGGSIEDRIATPLPAGPLMILRVAVQGAAWVNFDTGDPGAPPLNAMSEVSNNDPVNFAAVVTQPLPDLWLGPRWMVSRKASWTGDPNPATAYPVPHTADVVVALLPSDF